MNTHPDEAQRAFHSTATSTEHRKNSRGAALEMLHRTELTTAQSVLRDRGSQWFNSVSRLGTRQSLYQSPALRKRHRPAFLCRANQPLTRGSVTSPPSHQGSERRISRTARACMSFPTFHRICLPEGHIYLEPRVGLAVFANATLG